MRKIYNIKFKPKQSNAKFEAFGMFLDFNRRFTIKDIESSKINSNNDLVKFMFYGTPYECNEVKENQFFEFIKKFSKQNKDKIDLDLTIYDTAVEFKFSYVDSIAKKTCVCEKEQYWYDDELGAFNDSSYKTIEDVVTQVRATVKLEKNTKIEQAIADCFDSLNRNFVRNIKKSIKNKKNEINKQLENIDGYERML